MRDLADRMDLAPTQPTYDALYSRNDDTQPMIFLCATMWHENEKEMLQILKSIVR